jgi:hypothetical protein
MKKVFLLVWALLAGGVLLGANRSDDKDRPWYVSLSGGPMLNVYENYFTYGDNGKSLFSWQGALSVGYNFTQALGARLQVEGGQNLGACNTMETSARGFYPYNFYNVNVFADAVLDLLGLRYRDAAFRPKLLAGIGMGNTFGFNVPDGSLTHPWQWKSLVKKSNMAFGFRAGAMAEYNFNSRLGIFAELLAEAYTDNYNGLQPTNEDKTQFKGYPGFPLDLRGLFMFGLLFRF